MRHQVQWRRHEALIDRVGGESEQLKGCGAQQCVDVVVADDAEYVSRAVPNPHNYRGEFADDRSPICQDELGPVVGHYPQLGQQVAGKQTVRCARVYERVDASKRPRVGRPDINTSGPSPRRTS